MYDVLIQNAKVVDGTGNPWFYGDVALKGEEIAAITPAKKILSNNAVEVIDGTGLVVSPGFIDIQSHSIAPLMIDGRSLSKIMQGVTTEIMGEGWTPAPFGPNIQNPIGFSVFTKELPEWIEKAKTWTRFGQWMDAMQEVGTSPNIGSYLGAGTLRQFAMGLAMRRPSSDELAIMQRVMAESMEDGAFGISYALIYPPDSYTDTQEIIDVCKVVSEYNGSYIVHIRSEAAEIFEALEETFEIAREADLPVEIYHLKASGRKNWDKMPRVMEMINGARAQGLDITADMYPYPASGTGLTAILPPWIAADGKLFKNLADPDVRERIKEETYNPNGGWEAMASEDGAEIVMPIGFQKEENQKYVGMRLSEIAEECGQDWVTAAMDLILDEGQRISTIYYGMSEDNLKLQLQQPWIKISTDAGGFDPEWATALGPTHPRAYGTYPRVLGKYVRDEKVIPLEDCIRKMSGAVADRLNLRDRGLLREGMKADIILFNPDTIIDKATFEAPHQLAVGVQEVWVNGVRTVKDAEHTGAKYGQIVRGAGK